MDAVELPSGACDGGRCVTRRRALATTAGPDLHPGYDHRHADRRRVLGLAWPGPSSWHRRPVATRRRPRHGAAPTWRPAGPWGQKPREMRGSTRSQTGHHMRRPRSESLPPTGASCSDTDDLWAGQGSNRLPTDSHHRSDGRIHISRRTCGDPGQSHFLLLARAARILTICGRDRGRTGYQPTPTTAQMDASTSHAEHAATPVRVTSSYWRELPGY